jgi:tRNA pseudouridine13 synthase
MLPDWPRASGPPILQAEIRRTPADFIVTEILEVGFSGDGEHDWLQVEKTGANTAWVAGRLASHAGVPVRDVGFSGLKDRHAITRQWFSVRRARAEGCDWLSLDVEGVRIVEVQRHSRKLRRGTHRGNAFCIALRGDQIVASSDDVTHRLETMAEQGVPNYFGEQRFGKGGSTIALGQAVLRGRRLPKAKRSLGISALRSLEFNNELARRVDQGTWNTLAPGGMANLDGTGSVFEVETITPELEQRCREMDIHPAGRLPAIERLGVAAAWRPLRTRVPELRWTISGDALWLEFRLPRGSYATAVLREFSQWSSTDGK